MPSKLPYYNYNLNKFFKDLYFINQQWFNVREKLTDSEGFELERMIDKVKLQMQDIQFKLGDLQRQKEGQK